MVYLAAFWSANSGSNKAEVDNAVNQLNSVLQKENAGFEVAVVGYEQVIDRAAAGLIPYCIGCQQQLTKLHAHTMYVCLSCFLIGRPSSSQVV